MYRHMYVHAYVCVFGLSVYEKGNKCVLMCGLFTEASPSIQLPPIIQTAPLRRYIHTYTCICVCMYGIMWKKI